MGATDKTFAGRAWDVWVAYNTTGETVQATFGVKDQGPMEFEDTFSDGDCSDWGLESAGNYSISVTPEGALWAHHKVGFGYSKFRHNIGSGIYANNCTLEFDVMYLTANAALSILYQDRGPYSSPGIPALFAAPDTTGIWHHVELHVYDGSYDYIVNNDVVRENYPLPALNPNYRTYIGIFCFNGDFLIDNVRHVDEEYSLVQTEITGVLMPTNPAQAFWASVPDYDPDKIDHNGTTQGSEYEWYVQFKENGMEARQDVEVYFAPRLMVEATNFPTLLQPGTTVKVPVDWEGLDGLVPAALRIELVEPIMGITAASADFMVTSPDGWGEYSVAIPADLRGSHAYLWVAYLYATNAVSPYEERIGLDDTYRFNRYGFPVQPETVITVSETLPDSYVVYDDKGIPMDSQVYTWGVGTFDAKTIDPNAPEGSTCFKTVTSSGYGAGWGIFKTGMDMSSYAAGNLRFWLKSSNTIKIELEGPQGTKRTINVPSTSGVWTEHTVAITNFNGLNLASMFGLFAVNQGSAGTYSVDNNIRWEKETEGSVNFNDVTILRYDTSQDINSTQYEILDGGATLHLWGNNWKAIANGYTITPNTVLEFDFKSTGTPAEINGVGCDADLRISADRIFQVHGTQSWGIQTYKNYSGTDWKHYTIPIGTRYTGALPYLCFANDADAGQATDIYYRNVRMYEASGK